MVWGFGGVGYGPWRTDQMLQTDDAAAILADIVGTVRAKGAAEGYRKLFTQDGHGKPRVSYLSVVSGTKLLYFAGMGYDLSPRPLIYDAYVSKRLRSLRLDLPWAVDPGALSTEQYDQYCRWAEGVAQECGVESDDVECALFG